MCMTLRRELVLVIFEVEIVLRVAEVDDVRNCRSMIWVLGVGTLWLLNPGVGRCGYQCVN